MSRTKTPQVRKQGEEGIEDSESAGTTNSISTNSQPIPEKIRPLSGVDRGIAGGGISGRYSARPGRLSLRLWSRWEIQPRSAQPHCDASSRAASGRIQVAQGPLQVALQSQLPLEWQWERLGSDFQPQRIPIATPLNSYAQTPSRLSIRISARSRGSSAVLATACLGYPQANSQNGTPAKIVRESPAQAPPAGEIQAHAKILIANQHKNDQALEEYERVERLSGFHHRGESADHRRQVVSRASRRRRNNENPAER